MALVAVYLIVYQAALLHPCASLPVVINVPQHTQSNADTAAAFDLKRYNHAAEAEYLPTRFARQLLLNESSR